MSKKTIVKKESKTEKNFETVNLNVNSDKKFEKHWKNTKKAVRFCKKVAKLVKQCKNNELMNIVNKCEKINKWLRLSKHTKNMFADYFTVLLCTVSASYTVHRICKCKKLKRIVKHCKKKCKSCKKCKNKMDKMDFGKDENIKYL